MASSSYGHVIASTQGTMLPTTGWANTNDDSSKRIRLSTTVPGARVMPKPPSDMHPEYASSTTRTSSSPIVISSTSPSPTPPATTSTSPFPTPPMRLRNPMDDYEEIAKCGSGTYGSVYKALDKRSNRLVAIKRVTSIPREDGEPVETKYLAQLTLKDNVIGLYDHFYIGSELVMIFEYMEYDMWQLMSGPKVTFTINQIKGFVMQLLQGLDQIHSEGVMHRDIKPSNLLLNTRGQLKLADFGLTTSFILPPQRGDGSGNSWGSGSEASRAAGRSRSGKGTLSPNVVSLYYRPPELLLGSHQYGAEIDVWSVGCILVEMINQKYLFAGESDEHQLELICRVFGTPTEETWPGVTQMPNWKQAAKFSYAPQDLHALLPALTPDCLDLVKRMLSPDPSKRITSKEALSHPWFTNLPAAVQPPSMPRAWNIGGHGTVINKKYAGGDTAHKIRKQTAKARPRAKAKAAPRPRGRPKREVQPPPMPLVAPDPPAPAPITSRSTSSSSSSSSSTTTTTTRTTSRLRPRTTAALSPASSVSSPESPPSPVPTQSTDHLAKRKRPGFCEEDPIVID
eukprot:TRINITY_DN7230_c0_g1_i1.p1 TRINITY_DN7230_c0_g1~~TRINITY_DN7230_c0_g1_i1.p1  ORF type:complete len:568 (+),score=118.16 TRINITY_DN7230_c0_g1_i1:176-1879(+)